MQITEISDATELGQLSAEWDDLIRRSPNASIFQTWEWTSTYWRHLGKGKRLVLLCARDNGRLVGLAPFKIASIHGLPLRKIGFIGSYSSDYLDLVLDQEAEAGVLEAIFSWLKQNDNRWDVLDLEKIPEASPTLEHWPELRRRFGWHNSLAEYGTCPYLLLPESWDEMRTRMGRKQRASVDSRERMMRRDFRTEIGLLGTSELEEGMDSLIRLHARRWERNNLPGCLAAEDIQGFVREVSWLLAKRGWLALYGIRLDGQLQSVYYCMTHGDKGYSYISGWEPSLARYGLGSVLTAQAIRHMIEQEIREFDFLCGDESYKSRWARESHTNLRLVAHKNNARSRLAAAVTHAERQLGQKTKLILLRCLTALKNVRFKALPIVVLIQSAPIELMENW